MQSQKLQNDLCFQGKPLNMTVSSVSVAQSWPTLCDPMIPACQASLSITNSQSSLRLMSIESVMPSSHLILCRPLLLLPPIPPSIRVFANESTLRMRWPKYWTFSFSISPSSEYSGLISLKIDWFDLHGVQGTFRSLLQHHSLKAINSLIQLPQPYMTTGKTIQFSSVQLLSHVRLFATP